MLVGLISDEAAGSDHQDFTDRVLWKCHDLLSSLAAQRSIWYTEMDVSIKDRSLGRSRSTGSPSFQGPATQIGEAVFSRPSRSIQGEPMEQWSARLEGNDRNATEH